MSFSGEAKKEICGNIKRTALKKCCGISLLYGMLINANIFKGGHIIIKTENEYVAKELCRLVMKYLKFECDVAIHENKFILYRIEIPEENAKKTLKFLERQSAGIEGGSDNLFKCTNCRKNFIRGIFLSCGTIGTPENTYHLELNMGSEKTGETIADILKSEGFEFKTFKRKKHIILYLKESEKIEDFLYYLGSKISSFKIMDTKIIKELRNNANRTRNFETANLARISTAVAYQITLIEKLIDRGILDTLDYDLRETAMLRKDNIELSLEEIAELSTRKISKSGINHRLKKLIAIAERLE